MAGLTTSISVARTSSAPPAFVSDVDAASSDVLRLGSTGPDVNELQQQLNATGEKLTVNAYFSPRTAEAVRRFQLASDIRPANGVATAKTRRALAAQRPSAWVHGDGFDAAPASRKPTVALNASQAAAAAPNSVLLKTQDGQLLTVEQGLARLNLANTKAHDGRLGTKVASALTGGALGEAAQGRDQLVAMVNHRSQSLMAKGYLTLKDRQELAVSISGALSSVRELQGLKSEVVGAVANTGTAAVLVGATLFTGGVAAPLTLPVAAGLGVTGVAARVGIKGSLEGSGYSAKEAVQDAAIGGAQGATSLVGGSFGGAVGKSVARTVARAGLQPLASGLKGAASGAAQGSLGGAVAGASDTAVRAETWKGGKSDALKKVARAGASGAASGGAGGGTLGGLAGAAATRTAPRLLVGEEVSLRKAKEELVKDIAQDITTRSKGKVSESSTLAFLEAYSKARALPESGKIPAEQLGFFPQDPEVGARLFEHAEPYFDLNQRHIQAVRRVAAYGPDASVLATFTSNKGKLSLSSGSTAGIEGFAERFSSQGTEQAYIQSVADSGRPATTAGRIADRERWYRDTWLGTTADQSVGWQQARKRSTGTYTEWKATQLHLEESGLHFLNGTFTDGQAIQLKPGTEVTFQRAGRAENLSSDVRGIFLGVDQGRGAVEVKNAIDPSFTGGGLYTHQAEYRFEVPANSDWVFIRGRVRGTGAARSNATGSVWYETGGAEQLVIWDRKAQAPVSLASAGVAVRRTRLDLLVR